MAASEAAVTAVMETLGCSRYRREFSHPEPFVYDYCVQHSAEGEQSWSDRGCPVAVAAADAAVDADRASIQAEALRAIRALADEAERGEGLVITPGFSIVYAIEVGRLRAAMGGGQAGAQPFCVCDHDQRHHVHGSGPCTRDAHETGALCGCHRFTESALSRRVRTDRIEAQS